MNNTSIDIIRHEPKKVFIRQNFRRFDTDAKYQVIKIGKYVTLQHYIQLHKLFLDKRHMTVFTLLVNATQTMQFVMDKGTIIHITGEGNVDEQTVIITKPGLLAFQVPDLQFSLKFHISEPIELLWKGRKYLNVICVCRQYF